MVGVILVGSQSLLAVSMINVLFGHVLVGTTHHKVCKTLGSNSCFLSSMRLYIV